jgi:hypothetical protein
MSCSPRAMSAGAFISADIVPSACRTFDGDSP